MAKRGDEAFIRMLVDDARLAAGGTPAARSNHLRPSGHRLHRNMVIENVCHDCEEPAVVSKRVFVWGKWTYRKYCMSHLPRT